MRKLWMICLTVTFLSCSKQAAKKTVDQINIDSLLDKQITILSKSDVRFTKTSNINQHISTTEILSNAVNWKSEFEPFRSLAVINKPILASSYNTTVEADKKSNLVVKTWEANRDLSLTKLKVFYFKDFSKIKRIEATISLRNFVFSSTKELSLDFSVLGMKPIADGFEVMGHQKFLWEDPQYFSLKGNIHVK